MPDVRYKTKVVLNNGREYIFDEPPGDFLKNVYDDQKCEFKSNIINGDGFFIISRYISSIEKVEIRENRERFLLDSLYK